MKKLPKNYKPTAKEKFMNSKMKEYFRLKLIDWKKDLLKESSNTLNNLQKEENTTITEYKCESFHLETASVLRIILESFEAQKAETVLKNKQKQIHAFFL